jgi:hypothetical protein
MNDNIHGDSDVLCLTVRPDVSSKLWWKVWSCQPSPLGHALLPEVLQGRVPRESSE